MLVYEITSLPDITLSKYQSVEESGIESMLEAQTRLIRQLYRFTAFGKIIAHYVYIYDPQRPNGNKLKIYIVFTNKEHSEQYNDSIDKIIKASSIFTQFGLKEIKSISEFMIGYKVKGELHKKERLLQTVTNGTQRTFYIVPNWKINDNARLYSVCKLMQSFDMKCCYCVDIFTEENAAEQIHKNFERPLTFLRNDNMGRTGLENSENRFVNNSDPNVNETLRQYEKWNTRVDESNVFQCRISSYADDSQYARLLLDTVFAESVISGNNTINIMSGDFQIANNWNQIPSDQFLAATPPTMQKWSTTYLTEELAPFVRLPVLYDGENIELPKETVSILSGTGIEIGTDRNGYDVVIPEKLFAKHMFVCGVPGSGKTNTMLHLANSLWNAERIAENGQKTKLHIPFLVLEPAKREYRELARFNIPELIIFSPSACTDFPIKINPFEFPKGLTVSEHISKLCQVFEGAFPIAPPAPFVLDRAIQAIYEKHGWKSEDINIGVKEYPTMSELYEQFEKELQHTNYDSEIQGNIRSVLEMRIGSLLRREMKDVFDAKKSTLTPEEWMQYPIIVELESLGEGPANFLTLLLCTLIRETLKATPAPNIQNEIRHVIFIEEAHNLIASRSQNQDGQDSNPKIAATAFIVKMLAEVRALKEGIVIADQLPTAMASEVIKNTNIKLVHRLTSQDDRELVGSTMNASSLQMENMGIYTSGQALFTFEKMLRPMEIQVNLVEEHEETAPDDCELAELMMNPSEKPVYYRLRKLETLQQWEDIKTRAKEINEQEQKAIEHFINMSVEKITLSKLESQMDSFLIILDGIKIMKRRLLWECERIDERFIPKEKKEKLNDILLTLGNQYEKVLRNAIINA